MVYESDVTWENTTTSDEYKADGEKAKHRPHPFKFFQIIGPSRSNFEVEGGSLLN